tara:strand:+ start:360 stop:623 length:264 start_codon:yes stop_codon:yes gene_type:complete
MLRFYNGFSPEQLDEMSVIEFDQYWLAITKIEAQEMLLNLTISDYPQLKPVRRREIFNNLKKHSSNENAKLLTNDDIAEALKALNVK